MFPSPSLIPGRHLPVYRRAIRLVATAGLVTMLAAGLSLHASAEPRHGTATEQVKKVSGIQGIDVSNHQGDVNWQRWWQQGKRFAYVKATEGTSYQSPSFDQQYLGSYKVGMIRGAYHFARPDGASGKAQARYFAAHGGAWSADGQTLPGMLDLEQNYTGGDRCYNTTPAQLQTWVQHFITEYRAQTSRAPVIYTNATFWKDCLNNTTAFRDTSPLSIASYTADPADSLPGGWPYYTFWQYEGSGTDLDVFNGSMDRLKALANGS